MTAIKRTKNYWCAAEGCNSDDRKRGKYGFMADIEFFPFPSSKTNKKARNKWLDLLRRENYEPTYQHRICSRHFVDGRPTEQHPYPELFAYNGYKRSENTRSAMSIQKRMKQSIQPTPMDIDSSDEETQSSWLSGSHFEVMCCFICNVREL